MLRNKTFEVTMDGPIDSPCLVKPLVLPELSGSLQWNRGPLAARVCPLLQTRYCHPAREQQGWWVVACLDK